MSWEAVFPWAFTLLCPLSMLWCMRSMGRQGSCHTSAADPKAGIPDPRAEVVELRQRLAEMEARHAEVDARRGTKS